MALGIFIGLKANHIANIPESKIPAEEQLRVEHEGKQNAIISDILVFGGLLTLISIPVIDFTKWAKE